MCGFLEIVLSKFQLTFPYFTFLKNKDDNVSVQEKGIFNSFPSVILPLPILPAPIPRDEEVLTWLVTESGTGERPYD